MGLPAGNLWVRIARGKTCCIRQKRVVHLVFDAISLKVFPNCEIHIVMPKIEISLASIVDSELVGLIESAPLPTLGEGPDHPELRRWLNRNARQTPELAVCGLWLLCGDLNLSHEISQRIETPDGSFWHGIMHRREGDFWNSKYWFRRVGKHPVLKSLAQTPYGDAQAFVDRCEAAMNGNEEQQVHCQELQWLEWQHLFAHCSS